MAEEEHAVETDLISAAVHVPAPLSTSQLVQAGRILTGSSRISTGARGPLSSILCQRLTKIRAEFSELSLPAVHENLNPEELQSVTGYAALKILEAIDVAFL